MEQEGFAANSTQAHLRKIHNVDLTDILISEFHHFERLLDHTIVDFDDLSTDYIHQRLQYIYIRLMTNKRNLHLDLV